MNYANPTACPTFLPNYQPHRPELNTRLVHGSQPVIRLNYCANCGHNVVMIGHGVLWEIYLIHETP